MPEEQLTADVVELLKIPHEHLPEIIDNTTEAANRIVEANQDLAIFNGPHYVDTGNMWTQVVSNFLSVLSESNTRVGTAAGALQDVVISYAETDEVNAEEVTQAGAEAD